MNGIYVHIPFCVSKCHYCDFYSVSNQEIVESYFKRLKKEIYSYKKYGKLPVDTVFFGGGTPSLPNEKYICETLLCIYDCFDVCKNAEITLEMNPKTFDENKLRAYKNAGVNRLSVGLQSANDDELLKIGRIHTSDDFLKSYEFIKKVGFDNVSVDIMYGLPYSDIDTLSKTSRFVKSLGAQHISAYALTLCENTPIMNMNYNYPDNDSVYEQYKFLCREFSEYRHYEISNFGKIPSRHNLKYWNLDSYIGFGASAYSYFDNKRFNNVKSIQEYIERENSVEDIYENTFMDNLNEYIMLSLRCDEGINTEYMKNKFSYSFPCDKKEYIAKLKNANYVSYTTKGFRLTEDGFFVSNSIISELLIDKQ